MHRSRLCGFIIDCGDGNLDDHAGFWSGALGFAVRPSKSADDRSYVLLDADERDLVVELQSVDHPSRVHLDIEADDVEAEVRRLEDLGARRIAQVKTWWVLEAPSGHRFCVVRAQGRDFDANANRWP